MVTRSDRLGLLALSALCLSVGCQTPAPGKAPGVSRSPSGTNNALPSETDAPRVRIETSHGTIDVELDVQAAPATCLNFLHYARKGHYEGTVFHRVVKDTLIQGGKFTRDMQAKPLEIPPLVTDTWHSPLNVTPGSIALVRPTPVEPRRTAEFFIRVGEGGPDVNLDEGFRQRRFAVFGRVVDGEPTLEKIRNVAVGTHPSYAAGRNPVVPQQPVVIRSVSLLSAFDRDSAMKAAELATAPDHVRAAEWVRRIEEETGRRAVKTESGLIYIDLVVGEGAVPIATDEVRFDYHGTLLNGYVFQSTRETEPVVRQISSLIPGLQEGLLSMSEGGRRILIMPPELGYGAGGVPGFIPPNATIMYEIDLLAIE